MAAWGIDRIYYPWRLTFLRLGAMRPVLEPQGSPYQFYIYLSGDAHHQQGTKRWPGSAWPSCYAFMNGFVSGSVSGLVSGCVNGCVNGYESPLAHGSFYGAPHAFIFRAVLGLSADSGELVRGFRLRVSPK